MPFTLEGKVAVVTGGTRGIGLEIARSLAQAGASVAICGRSQPGVDRAVKELTGSGGRLIGYPADVSNADEVARFFEAVVRDLQKVDILINNAGAIPRGSLADVSPQAWRHGWDLKVYGYIDLTRYILPRMKARRHGVIINIIGMAGERPEPNYIATSCGNAALMMFTQCLGGESVRDGVRIVGINPGPIMSDRHRRGAERVAERQLGSKDRWPELYKRFPIGRPGRVEEVAGLVAFLASDLASYISGEIIRVDAGLKVRDPVY